VRDIIGSQRAATLSMVAISVKKHLTDRRVNAACITIGRVLSAAPATSATILSR